MRALILALLAALLLSGCASYVWYRPDVTEAQAARDSDECSRQARYLANDYLFWGPPYAWSPWGPAWPYWQPWPDPTWRFDVEQRVYGRCMEFKGYQLRKVEKQETRR